MFSGIVVREQIWADRLAFDPVELTDVIVEEDTGVGSMIVGDDHLATWGMAALKRVRLIVDGRRNVAYVKPEEASASAPGTQPTRSGLRTAQCLEQRTGSSCRGMEPGLRGWNT